MIPKLYADLLVIASLFTMAALGLLILVLLTKDAESQRIPSMVGAAG